MTVTHPALLKAMPEKCCGTCKWWKPKSLHPDMGDCMAPIPSSVWDMLDESMHINSGDDCPCHQPKEPK